MLVLTGVLLVAVSTVVGVLTADWGFWKRYINLPKDPGEWPEAFYQPKAGIDGPGAAFFPAATPEAVGIDPAALDAASAWSEANNSVALIVLRGGRTVLERYWQGMTAEQSYSGRAMSRSIVGMVYGFAVADGKLALDDPAEKFLPEWRNDPRGRITIRQLLQNLSGLEEVPLNVGGPFSKNTRLSLGSDFGAAALSFRLQHETGGRFYLSNANPQLLGLILQRATGIDYARYVEQRLWRPMGGAHADFYMDRERGMPAVYCCFRARPRDFARLGQLLAADGRVGDAQVLPPGWVAQMRQTTGVNPLYGFQIWSGRAPAGIREYTVGSGQGIRHAEAFATGDVLWMEGGGGRTIWAIPSKQLVIVRLGRASKTWDGSVLPNTIYRGLRD
jgi:CubicO group peptidase (beta-lactamase class C family)